MNSEPDGPQLLVDTNFLIAHLRQRPARTTLDKALTVYGKGAISVVSQIEYDAGEINAGRRPNFPRDFEKLVLLHLSEPILKRAPYIQAQSVRINHKMNMGDLLIAATAIYHKLPLLTLNSQHFRHITNLRLLKVL